MMTGVFMYRVSNRVWKYEKAPPLEQNTMYSPTKAKEQFQGVRVRWGLDPGNLIRVTHHTTKSSTEYTLHFTLALASHLVNAPSITSPPPNSHA